MHSTKSVILSLLPTGCHSSAHQLIRPLIEEDNRRQVHVCGFRFEMFSLERLQAAKLKNREKFLQLQKFELNPLRLLVIICGALGRDEKLTENSLLSCVFNCLKFSSYEVVRIQLDCLVER